MTILHPSRIILCLIPLLLSAAPVIRSTPYNKIITYPLLNTPNRIKITGDSTGENTANWSVMQSVICKKSKYTCTVVGSGEKFVDAPSSGLFDAYSIVSDDIKLKAAYPYRYELRTGLKGKDRLNSTIDGVLLYSSPRPETGLIDWEISLIDTVVKAFVGQPINKLALKKCYNVSRDDSRDGCKVQNGKLNGVNYSISVNFIYLENAPGEPMKPSPRPGLRNFSVRIFPENVK